MTYRPATDYEPRDRWRDWVADIVDDEVSTFADTDDRQLSREMDKVYEKLLPRWRKGERLTPSQYEQLLYLLWQNATSWDVEER